MAQQLIMIGPAAPARKTLNHDVQQRFLTYIDNWDYVGLVDEIERQDRAYGPEFTVSRINRALVSNWRARGIQMLLRTDREILRAAVMNELPRRALTNDPAQHISVRTAAMARTAGNDPVIYINWLADRQGNGLTLDEFKQLMAFLVSVLEGGDAAARVDSIWNNWTAGNRDGLMRGCTANERVKVTAFLHYHDTVTLPAMQRDRTIEQMMIPGEVGWAIDFRNRSAAHRILGSASPWMFRLVSCAIRHLFGTRFVMHQFVLFNVVTPEEAGIGESMASHLVASYANYGGFNFDQAAKTATRMHVMDPTETWLMIATRAFTQLHYFTHTDNNLRAWQAYNTRRYQAAKVGSSPSLAPNYRPGHCWWDGSTLLMML